MKSYHCGIFKAFNLLCTNKNIKVVISDKGKQTVICYRSTYDALVNSHFSDRSLYQPVVESDVAGRDLDQMTSDLRAALTELANEAPDIDDKNIIKCLYPPRAPRFPEGRVNLKTHKSNITHTNIPVRPVISNTKSPTSVLASFLGKRLSGNLGLVSDKHLKSAEDFSNFIQNCSTEGRILSLDVVNLFTCIPRDEIIRFLRDKSNGWVIDPPELPDGSPPVYNFGMNSKIFCDLVELCLSYNQFHIDGSFLRQIHGLFMGSSISPPLAMMYMEAFESELYERLMPNHIKAKEWKRYVDDCFIVYTHGEIEFQEFYDRLNALNPYIKFTCENSKPGVDVGLNSDVLEALPFLDLLVMRHFDKTSKSINNIASIYRKPCHSNSYIHALSCQPISVKRAVIRNLFLRAFRYCHALYIEEEECKIYEDFAKLGYSRSFIGKARMSAKEGRQREIRIRMGLEQQRPPRERRRYHLSLKFHSDMNGLEHRLKQLDTEVTFSNTDSIRSRITRKSNALTKPSNSGVYVISCKKDDCGQIYIGQSRDVPKRLKQHTDAKTRASMQYYASAKHKGGGHNLDTVNGFEVYKSDSLPHRLTVESCLLAIGHKIDGNKASTSTRDFDTLAPMILEEAPIKWKMLSRIRPPCLRTEKIPRRYRKFFLLRKYNPL